MALALSQVIGARGAPVSITVDNGTEFASKAMDVWAYQYRVQLDFIRPGKPVENSYIESFKPETAFRKIITALPWLAG